MAQIQRGLTELLTDLDRRARPGRPSRNRPIQKYTSVSDTVQISSEVIITTVQTPPFQFALQSYRSAVIADAPLAYWRLGENDPAVTANDDREGSEQVTTTADEIRNAVITGTRRINEMRELLAAGEAIIANGGRKDARFVQKKLAKATAPTAPLAQLSKELRELAGHGKRLGLISEAEYDAAIEAVG